MYCVELQLINLPAYQVFFYRNTSKASVTFINLCSEHVISRPVCLSEEYFDHNTRARTIVFTLSKIVRSERRVSVNHASKSLQNAYDKL